MVREVLRFEKNASNMKWNTVVFFCFFWRSFS